MKDKKTSVFGIYPSLTQAERGVDALVQARFSNADVSVLAPDQQSTKDFAHEKHTKSPEGTAAGAATGGAVGGLIGALVGMGLPEYEAKRYEGRVKDGGVLLSVHCATSDEITRAKAILEETGADDIASSGEKSGEEEVAVPVRDRERRLM